MGTPMPRRGSTTTIITGTIVTGTAATTTGGMGTVTTANATCPLPRLDRERQLGQQAYRPSLMITSFIIGEIWDRKGL